MAIEYHPIFVHFPIALVTVALIFDIGRWIFDRERLLLAGFWGGTTPLLIAALVGGLAAVATGLPSKPQGDISATVRELVKAHETLGFVAISLLAGLLFWRIALRGRFPQEWSFVYLFGLLALGVVLTFGGYFGGQMVYSHGVGVNAPN